VIVPRELHQSELRLTTLGAAALTHEPPGGARIVVLGPGKPLALLTYLALAPQRSASRDYLLDLLWADVAGERARSTLRQTLWFLRRKLGTEAFETCNDLITLGLTLTVDRDEFIQAVRQGSDERALELYRGKFFPAFAAPGGAEFEQWVEFERARLHIAYERTVERYVASRLAGSSFAEAERAARAWRDMDPGRERAWRLLLETLAASGAAEAVRLEADALEIAFASDGREPEPGTRDLIRRLLLPSAAEGGQPSVPSGPLPIAELVGREVEFARVLSVWHEARRGLARCVHVAAPKGLGKTRLLKDLGRRLRADGMVVVINHRSDERGVQYLFARRLTAKLATLPGAVGVSPTAARGLLALDPSLAGRFPGASPSAGVPGDEGLAAALAELLDAVSEETPLALLIDDLDLVDEASRRLLEAVSHRLARQRILLVTASRPTASDPIDSRHNVTLDLLPLTEIQIEELLRSLAELPPELWATTLPALLAAATGGSPFLIHEVLAWLRARGVLRVAEGAWHCANGAALAREIAAVRQVAAAPLRRRSRRPAMVAIVAGAAVVLAVLLAPLGPRLLSGAGPRELAVLTTPISNVPGTAQLLPAPVVELRGPGVAGNSSVITVTAELARGDGELTGEVSVRVRQGRAVFDDLRLVGSGVFALQFISSEGDTAVSPEFSLVSPSEGSTLRLAGGRLNGQSVSPDRRRVVVLPGDTLRGEVRLVYTSRWGAASVILGATPTWGDPAKQALSIGPLATPAAEMPRSAPVSLAVPDEPGSYRLIFVFQAETSAAHILSGTNWTVGVPVWGDGNDVAGWSPAQLDQADRTGQVWTRQLWPDGRWVENVFAATTVEVVVREP